jgi:predicted PurR-regulated permease PerM
VKKSLVKKNLTLFSVIIATGVVSLVLLLYVIWQCVTLIGYQDRINKAQSKGKTLVRQKPNPGNANEQLIREDIVTYQKAAEALRKQFKSPLQSALDEFFVKLQPPLAAVMTEEEVEAFLEALPLAVAECRNQ